MYCRVMISSIGEYKSVIIWNTGYIEVLRGNSVVYVDRPRDVPRCIYRILNSLQEARLGSVGIRLLVREQEDWAVRVDPSITGAGWLADYKLRAVIGARCLDGLCILARRHVSDEVSYVDSRSYIGELVAAALGYRFIDF